MKYDADEFVEMVAKHEGMVLEPYRDSLGISTIGIGRNLEDGGITDVELDYVRLREYIQLNLPTRQIMMNLQDVQGWWPNQNLIEWAREHVTLRAL